MNNLQKEENSCELCDVLTSIRLLADGEERYICEDCDSEFTYCNVCQEHHWNECIIECRHLQWNDNLCFYIGAGCDISEWEIVKPSILYLCRLLGPLFTQDLKLALKNHCYFFQLNMRTLNCYGIEMCLNKMSNDYGKHLFEIIDNLDKEQQFDCVLAINWLLSLWSGKEPLEWKNSQNHLTKEADLMTVEWIETLR
ncbi:hypothetical protein [Crocosphaera chwakensis]|uniref:Uncharacterized protein n=1 Tax=Crocosphaera chwakensis CCY0110 TaxID=391612 RepID=A3IZ62_9CHRO|nr:hypothetical protein [Crocosphaera chwakensis]EAZ88232.1 hypothetical protein CY0110_01250 [Crocosphaera chwakensis CCY0110]